MEIKSLAAAPGGPLRYSVAARKTSRQKAAPGEASVRERILATATRLFMTQGYPNTGINQIIAESGTAKASFYDYFPAKEDLGCAYLSAYGEGNLALLDHLARRFENPMDFLAAWVRILKRNIRREELYGCAMANLHAQLGGSSPVLDGEIRKLAKTTIRRIAAYLEEAQANGRLDAQASPRLLARRIFSIYEGALQTWRLSGELAAIEDLVVLGGALLERR